MRYSKFRTLLMAGCTALALSPAFALAQTAPARTYNIPAQDLGTALTQFGQQSEREIVFSADLTRNRKARAVSGEMTANQALAMLLSDSGLTYRSSPNGSIIVEASDPQSGSAAGDGADQGTVQALIVTAQKREENIQDVPIAMSAFTQEDLTRSQVAGGPDLMTQVPNMTFTKTNFTSYSIQLRGIGTQAISATTDAAVAVAFNNTPFIRNRFFEQEFYDLQRIEVLRGPQGTLYGRNATAGVVNLISAKPKFSYEARLSADVGNYKSTRLEGMLNIPLADDVAALRIAGAWTKRDGYTTNQLTGAQIDGRDLWSTRVSLRFAPTDRLDVNLIWEHFQEDDDRLRSGKQVCDRDVVDEVGGIATDTDTVNRPEVVQQQQGSFSQGCKPASIYAPESYQAPNGYALPYYHPLAGLSFPDVRGFDPYASLTQSRDLRVIESMLTPQYKAKSNIVELQAKFDLTPSLTITSETGYGTDRIFSFEDYNRFSTAEGAFRPFSADEDPVRLESWAGILDENGVFCDPQLGCASRLLAADVSTAKATQFSEEVRLSSNFDGPFNFSLGANFLRADTEDKYYVFINSLSLFSAMRGGPWQGYAARGPYQPGVTDNTACLAPDGPVEPNPFAPSRVGVCTYIDPNPIGSLNDQGHNYFLSNNPYKLISYAVFGESYYNITENLKLTAGLRWTVDKKEAPRIPSWVVAAETVGYPVAQVIDQEWREPTGRVALDFKPDLSFTDQTLLYASYAHGYKAGGANPPAAGVVLIDTGAASQAVVRDSLTIPKTFDPEFVNAFEVGTKNTLLDGRLTVNAGAFYYDYNSYQISYITDRSAVNLNFDAKIWGLELEADWRPIENLRLGLKAGYEDTRVADGERAIDVMDRTAGNPNWIVLRPHPAQSSNCVYPVTAVITGTGTLGVPGNVFGGGLSGCEDTWVLRRDPWTGATMPDGYVPDYPDWVQANNGEGFYKELGGNALPNAPHYTATITADYTIPLSNDWLATLHTDLYYQSEAWTRIFNDPGYDKLKTYSNVNIAAIFTNEDAGWKIMAYVKNVLDKDNITGAFLNSDDTGLTTNVFLNEPRLYGLRVTKEWNGGPWWTGGDPSHGGPFPLTVELGGQVQRQDAPYETVSPSFTTAFPAQLDAITPSQHENLDWGDGRSVRVTYRPLSSPWQIAAGVRYGRTNGSTSPFRLDQDTDPACAFAGDLAYLCARYPGTIKEGGVYLTHQDWARAQSFTRERHEIADFSVGRDVGLGGFESSIALGIRQAHLTSDTTMHVAGIPDWMIPAGWFYQYPSFHDMYQADLTAKRRFDGAGPMVGWEGGVKIAGDTHTGQVSVDWSASGGVIFGKQKTSLEGTEEGTYYKFYYLDTSSGFDLVHAGPPATVVKTTTAVNTARLRSVSVPVVDLSLGLSYGVGRLKLGAGYRWERYFNVLDVGNTEHKDADRTFDGPYFKVAVGFGG